MRRIVVTGLGVVTPLGLANDHLWSAIRDGRSAIGPVSLFDTQELPGATAAEVKDLSAIEFTSRKSVWAISRSITLGFGAARLALEDAGVSVKPEESNHGIGVAYGSTLGGLAPLVKFDQLALREGPRLANPLMFPSTGASAPACQISILLGLDAFNTTLSNGHSSGLDAIRYASQFIRLGRAHTVVAGGVEEICREALVACHRRRLLAGSKSGAHELCRPLDRQRTGTVLGEGSAALVLEDLDHARARKARIYAEVRGHGSSFDPSLGPACEPAAATASMRASLEEAQIDPARIDALFASANGSHVGDRLEMEAIVNVFGSRGMPAVTAVKSMLGESYSAAGCLQSAVALLALKYQTIPGTLHFESADGGFPSGCVVTRTQSRPLSQVMVNAFGQFRSHASLVLSTYAN
jgi:3-oxoacyl-[acyl-carrier-protein] synthase II